MKFLISSFTGLGNQLQKTPLISKIKEIYPDSTVDLIGDDRWGALDILKESGLINQVFKITPQQTKKDKLHTHKWLQANKHDVFLQPFDSNVPWLLRLIQKNKNIKCVAQYPTGWVNSNNLLKKLVFYSRLFFSDIIWIPALQGRCEMDLNLDLLEAFLNRPLQRQYVSWCGIKSNNSVLKKYNLEKSKYLCLQPGGANGAPSPKRWNPNHFIQLAEGLIKALPDYKIILVGDKGDSEHIISKYSWPEKTINLAGHTTLDDVANLLRYSSCVVAHDSGIMHLANAVKTNVVALYGPTDYTRTLPPGKYIVPLFSRTDAFAAMYNFGPGEKELAQKFPGFTAMDGISINDVFDAVLQIVADKENGIGKLGF